MLFERLDKTKPTCKQCHNLLVVALELLGLMVAAVIALPWAVEKSILGRHCALVEFMIPGRLTVVGRATSKERSGESHGISEGHGSKFILGSTELDIDAKSQVR